MKVAGDTGAPTSAVSQAHTAARAIAIYLPQFHPIAENDAWWGTGFTEWTNTAKAQPLFPGHYQPHVPADLGFYDLRLPEARAAQAALARRYGIEGFCYYHYWFGGRLLLQRPLEEVLRLGEPDFPFCVCWANQSWTGVWHGAPGRLLIEQTYPGDDDHRRHFEYLLPAFADRRAIRVDGKPLFLVYSPEELPDSARVLDLWRGWAVRAGLPGLFIVAEHREPAWNPKQFGFDARLDARLPRRRQWDADRTTWRTPLAKLRYVIADWRRMPTMYDYALASQSIVGVPTPGIESYPCVIPNWDNTPRSGRRGLMLTGSTPDRFRQQVRRAVANVAALPADHRIVFVKSWNEWAEGNHLEPDLEYGHQYLAALRDELGRA